MMMENVRYTLGSMGPSNNWDAFWLDLKLALAEDTQSFLFCAAFLHKASQLLLCTNDGMYPYFRPGTN